MKIDLLSLTANPLFGLALTVFVYLLSGWISRRCRSPFVHPLLVSGAILIILLNVLDIPLENYQQGGSVITMLLMPATAALAISVYRQVQVLKENFLPVVLGCLAGAVTAMTSAYGLSKLFGLDEESARARENHNALKIQINNRFWSDELCRYRYIIFCQTKLFRNL